MFCSNCGANVPDDALFCANCGTAIKQAAPVVPETPVVPEAPVVPEVPVAPAAPVTPVAPVAPTAPVAPVAPAAPVVPAAPVTPVAPIAQAPVAAVAPTAPKKPAKQHAKWPGLAFSPIIGFFLILSLIAIMAFSFVPSLFSAGNIEKVIKDAASTELMDTISQEVFSTDGSLTDVLAETIAAEAGLSSRERRQLSEDLEDLMKDSDLQEFLAEQVSVNVNVILKGKGKFEIDEKAVKKLLKDKSGKIEKLTGYDVNDYMNEIMDAVEEMNEDMPDARELREDSDYEDFMDEFGYLISGKYVLPAILVAAGLVVLLVLVNMFQLNIATLHLSIVSGIMTVITGSLVLVLRIIKDEIMESISLDFSDDVAEAVMGIFTGYFAKWAIAYVVALIVFIVATIMIKKAYKKKNQ